MPSGKINDSNLIEIFGMDRCLTGAGYFVATPAKIFLSIVLAESCDNQMGGGS
jgi:hypothetical protein